MNKPMKTRIKDNPEALPIAQHWVTVSGIEHGEADVALACSSAGARNVKDAHRCNIEYREDGTPTSFLNIDPDGLLACWARQYVEAAGMCSIDHKKFEGNGPWKVGINWDGDSLVLVEEPS